MKLLKQCMIAAALMAGATGTSIAQDAERPDALGIGVFTFTSGGPAAYGVPGRNGAELMIERINADGGIGGVPIEATYVDEAQGTEGVIAEFRRLAEDPSNELMVAALSSANCLALAPIAEQLEIPMLSWNCDTHQLLAGDDYDYVFRPNGNTIAEFMAYAIYLLDTIPDVSRVAIINPDYAFGHDAAEIFKRTLQTLKPDIEIVAELYPRLGSPTFQTEISRLSAARPDVVFSNLWGGDLENFVRQAEPRGLLQSSQFVLALGEAVLQRIDLPDGVIVGVLGDGYWRSPVAAENPQTQEFAEAYHEKYGEYPVFPTMKMANSFLLMKAAYEKAIAEKDGAWPNREEVANAFSQLQAQTFTGEVVLREDNEGIVDQIVGVTAPSEDYDFPMISEMVRYPGDALLPPIGEDPFAWIESLDPSFLDQLPKVGGSQ